ncbi:MAG: hypothetical protein ACLT2V_01710 [Escherichia coli]
MDYLVSLPNGCCATRSTLPSCPLVTWRDRAAGTGHTAFSTLL